MTAVFIAGDWGTSHLRLFLCDEKQILDRCEGPGIAAIAACAAPAEFPRIVHGLTGPWVREHGPMPMWFSGMVGSRNGWREAPYASCPSDESTLAASMLYFVADGHEIAIAPGLKCVNPRGAPDVLRGEETQIIGALAQHPDLRQGRHVFALPGTHTKWVLVEDGRVINFQTSFSGELYALLAERSTLSQVLNNTGSQATQSFEDGVGRARDWLGVPLSHLLFETRSRQLIGGLARPQALAFLSGLIIGQDVLGALGLFNGAPSPGERVTLIGTTHLLQLYRIVLDGLGLTALSLDASEATLQGLRMLAASSRQRGMTHVACH